MRRSYNFCGIQLRQVQKKILISGKHWGAVAPPPPCRRQWQLGHIVEQFLL